MNALHPREPKHIPSLEGLVDPNQVSRHLDAVAPPVEQKAAEAMGIKSIRFESPEQLRSRVQEMNLL